MLCSTQITGNASFPTKRLARRADITDGGCDAKITSGFSRRMYWATLRAARATFLLFKGLKSFRKRFKAAATRNRTIRPSVQRGPKWDTHTESGRRRRFRNCRLRQIFVVRVNTRAEPGKASSKCVPGTLKGNTSRECPLAAKPRNLLLFILYPPPPMPSITIPRRIRLTVWISMLLSATKMQFSTALGVQGKNFKGFFILYHKRGGLSDSKVQHIFRLRIIGNAGLTARQGSRAALMFFTQQKQEDYPILSGAVSLLPKPVPRAPACGLRLLQCRDGDELGESPAPHDHGAIPAHINGRWHGQAEIGKRLHLATCAACDLTGTYLKIEMMTFSVVWYAHVKAPRRSMGKDSNNTFPRNIFPRAVRAANRFLPAAFWKRCCGF